MAATDMAGFWLLMGHLVGDYIVQNDWMAKNKANPHPGPEPHPNRSWITAGDSIASPYGVSEQRVWWAAQRAWRLGHLACTAHCLLYTLAVWACTWWWMPWWGLAACFAAHWPLDRFRLARLWMTRVSGQAEFAAGPMTPWSVVVVDNVFHLLTLGLIAEAARKWA